MGDAIIINIKTLFSALFNCWFYCLLLLFFFLPLKTLFVINDSSFVEFSSFSCKINEFFLFDFMMFRERPRNQQKINTHSYASLVSFHRCAVFVISFYFLLWGLKKKAISLCILFVLFSLVN